MVLSTPRPLLTCQRCGLVHDVLDLEGLKVPLPRCCQESLLTAWKSLAYTVVLQRCLTAREEARKGIDLIADAGVVSENEDVRAAAVRYRNEAGKNRIEADP